MTPCTPVQRRLVSALAILAMLSLGWPVSAQAQFDEQGQTDSPTLILQPHCEETDQMLCPQFDVVDPSTLITPQYAPGDTLDLDVVLMNPTQEQIGEVRMWISYDSQALEGTSITVSPAFPTVMPGQADFSALSGYAKITASAAAGSGPMDAIIPVARLTFAVKNAAGAAETPLSFYDQRPGIDGHTFATTMAAPKQNLLSAPLGVLLVEFLPPAGDAQQFPTTENTYGTENSAAINPEVPVAPFGDPYAPTASPGVSTETAPFDAPPDLNALLDLPAADLAAQVTPDTADTFGLIQMQNVRIGTKDNSLYVTWDALSHPKLQGYNVYYGTMPGRYLNRHSVSVASRGAIIRDLPTGKTYFAAVRGVDDANQETAFSAEVSVEIGNPSTSSSPIVGTLDLVADVAPGASAPENPVVHMNETLEQGSTVPGKSGAPSGFVLLLLVSAAIGTLLACRRQMIASRRLHA